MAQAATQEYGRFAELLGPTLRNLMIEHVIEARGIWYKLRDISKMFDGFDEAAVAQTLEQLHEEDIVNRRRNHTGYEYSFNEESGKSQVLLRMFEAVLWQNAIDASK